MTWLHMGGRFATAILATASVLAVTAVTVFTAWAALGRHLDLASSRGAYELTGLSALWLYFVGSAFASLSREHIGGYPIGATPLNLWRFLYRMIRPVAELLTFLALAYAAYTMMVWQHDQGKVSVTLRWPSMLWGLGLFTGGTVAALIILTTIKNYFIADDKEYFATDVQPAAPGGADPIDASADAPDPAAQPPERE